MSDSDFVCCNMWKPGMEAINGPIITQTVRSGGAYQFDQKYRVIYCPWCGAKRPWQSEVNRVMQNLKATAESWDPDFPAHTHDMKSFKDDSCAACRGESVVAHDCLVKRRCTICGIITNSIYA